MPRVFASWSGGKDCCLAVHRAVASGLDVVYLANTVSGDGERSRSHGISAAVIKKQAEALDIPIMQQRTEGDNYEAQFVTMLKVFKKEGIEGGVFGDIDFNAHREWIERVCREGGMTPYLPLWEEDQKKLVEEFIDAGFVAMIVAAKAEFFGDEILGQIIDRDFLDRLEKISKTKKITPCGEAGEFHSLVIDGPLFKKRLEITESRHVEREGIHFLDVLNLELKPVAWKAK
jgi:uncharacterized protein (TIGR00290 family)